MLGPTHHSGHIAEEDEDDQGPPTECGPAVYALGPVLYLSSERACRQIVKHLAKLL